MAGGRGWSMVGYRDATDHERVEFAKRCVELYRSIFAKRCTPALGHLNEDGGPLNDACYMWFDWLSDAYIDFEDVSAPFPGQEALVDACRQILKIGHPACHEGALHGLGHLSEYYPDQVRAVVDAYLKENSEKSVGKSLYKYARLAGAGKVL